eukprot:Sspe_Gene.67297::Locus_39725_Transcript_1_1_Confidence_1.000_Length_981::g.67297::m.67297/K15734/SDR16C5; all-trans-retinol dehydrogenase (NAD+)
MVAIGFAVVLTIVVVVGALLLRRGRRVSWKGKKVLITGAAGGVGRELVKTFTREGARLVLWDTDLEGLADVRDIAGGSLVAALPVDVRSRDAVFAHRDEEIDLVICAAGVTAAKRAMELTPQDVDRTLQVNLNGVIWTSQAFIPLLAPRRGAFMVVASAVAGLGGVAGLSEYCASKWGVLGYVETLRAEVQQQWPTVAVIALCPSFIKTNLFPGVSFNTFQRVVTPVLHPASVAQEALAAASQGRHAVIFLPRIFSIIRIASTVLPVGLVDWLAHIYGVHSAAASLRRNPRKHDP